MSSTSGAATEAAADDLALTVVEEKPGRRFPAPCWTQEETLALIEAYRERWYALRRGYLRTADWDSVAETVVNRCPDASPAKTSAQCRHKMEKLRQRYRAEKQRSLSYPAGRFFSNWFFFENMDAMENGTQVPAAAAAASRSNQQDSADTQTNSGNALGLKTLIDQNTLKLRPNPPKVTKPAEDSNPNFGYDQEITPKNCGPRASNPYLSYLDAATSNKKEQLDPALHLHNTFGMKSRVDGIPLPLGVKLKKNAFNGDLRNGFDLGNIKEMGKLNPNSSDYNGINTSQEYIMRVLGDRNNSGRSYGGGVMEDSSRDFGVSNRLLSGLPRLGGNKNIDSNGGGGGGGGIKRERTPMDGMDQIASSIKFLAEGFVKIEKMKMEMAKEIEQMRMEREIKQSQMILESQKQLMDAFTKVMSELNNKKAKTAKRESS